jgi:hypothetical protein
MGMMLVWEDRKEYSEVWIEPPSLKVPIEERFWSPKGLSSCKGKRVQRFLGGQERETHLGRP